MDPAIRSAQEEVLRVFSKTPGDFALAGGTALELFYLHHRFSADLDFFSPTYRLLEIERLVFKEPVIRRRRGARVYSAENIYLQKIAATSGTRQTSSPCIDSFRKPPPLGRKGSFIGTARSPGRG